MNAATITRQSKSNLALAFVSLGRSANATSRFSTRSAVWWMTLPIRRN